MHEQATRYDLTDDQADLLAGACVLPPDQREELLRQHLEEQGADALLHLLVQSIGAANSVIANCREAVEIHLMSAGLSETRAGQINMPTLLGAMRGVKLANSVSTKGLCGGCAYRLGAVANQCHPTTIDASDCAGDNEAFLCHEKLDEHGRPEDLCAGHAQAVKNLHGAETPVLKGTTFGRGGILAYEEGGDVAPQEPLRIGPAVFSPHERIGSALWLGEDVVATPAGATVAEQEANARRIAATLASVAPSEKEPVAPPTEEAPITLDEALDRGGKIIRPPTIGWKPGADCPGCGNLTSVCRDERVCEGLGIPGSKEENDA